MWPAEASKEQATAPSRVFAAVRFGGAAVAVAFVAIAWRFLAFSGFNNDHYVHVARAYQIVRGDWPVRDFVDPGMPLMYLVSAGARQVFGPIPLAEWVVVAGGIAIGAACTAMTAARLSRSIGVSIGVAVLVILSNTRSFGYPKILLYAAGALAIVAVVAQPVTRRIFVLSCLIAAAFLFRHDHGLFIGVPALIAVVGASLAEGHAIAVRRALTLVAWIAILLLPWALFVQAHGGLVDYFAAGLRFWQAEAAEMTLGTLPTTDGSAIDSKSNALAWLFVVFHLLPWVCAAIAVWLIARGRERWRHEAVAVLALAAMGVMVNVFFMRESLEARIPDAVVPAALLGAWLIGLTMTRSVALVRASQRAAFVGAIGIMLLTAAAIVRAADVPEQMDRAQLVDSPAAVRRRAGEVWQELRRRVPDRDHAPSRYAAALLPFIEYVDRCTSPDDRLMVTGLLPEVYVVADRGFAGGHIAFMAPFYTDDADQQQTVERLEQESVPFVLVVQDVPLGMPRLLRHLEARYTPLTHVEVPGTKGVQVLVDRAPRPSSPDAATGWPCFSTR